LAFTARETPRQKHVSNVSKDSTKASLEQRIACSAKQEPFNREKRKLCVTSVLLVILKILNEAWGPVDLVWVISLETKTREPPNA